MSLSSARLPFLHLAKLTRRKISTRTGVFQLLDISIWRGHNLSLVQCAYLSTSMNDAAPIRSAPPTYTVTQGRAGSPLRSKKQSDISKQVQLAYQTGKSLKVLNLVRDANKNGISLDAEDCVTALICAAKLAVGKNANPLVLSLSDNFAPTALPATTGSVAVQKWGSLEDIYELSIDVLTRLSELGVVSPDAYLSAMKVCAEAKNPQAAMDIMAEIKAISALGVVESIQAEYVKALCSAVHADAMVAHARDRKRFVTEGIKAYESYRVYQQENNLKSLDDSVYAAGASAYAYTLQPGSSSARLIVVLKDMIQDGFEPRVKLCRSLLSSALQIDDNELIHIMVEWFLVHFDYPVEDGVISTVMGHAEKQSDLMLARLAIKLKEKSFGIRNSMKSEMGSPDEATGNSPALEAPEECHQLGSNGVTVWDYASAVMIAVHKKSTVAAVELLTESEAMGVDVQSTPLGVCVWEQFVTVCNNLRKLDALYFGLVELARQNSSTRIPRMALNAVIGASGKVGGVDRAFATFAEYDKVFGLNHDIHSYNALLFATSKFRNSKVLSMLSIFQDMERKGIEPNYLSFSYLLDLMADRNDLSTLPTTLNIMGDRGIRPRGRSLRRVAYAALDLGKLDLLDELKQLMKSPGLNACETGRSNPPTPLLYSFEQTLKRKEKKIGTAIQKAEQPSEMLDAKLEV